MSAVRSRPEASNNSASMRIELGIASADQMGSDAQSGWTFRGLRFQECVVLSFDVLAQRLSRDFSRTIRIQQVVKPLDHDSGWKISERYKFLGNHVAIRVEAST